MKVDSKCFIKSENAFNPSKANIETCFKVLAILLPVEALKSVCFIWYGVDIIVSDYKIDR